MGNDLITSESEGDALVRLLAVVEPNISQLREVHQSEYGELLLTVFLGDVARWSFGDDFERRLLDALNCLLIVGSPSVRNVILTGFVEAVPVDIDINKLSNLSEPLRLEIARVLDLER